MLFDKIHTMKKITGLLLSIAFLIGACSPVVRPEDIGLPAGMSNVPTPTLQVGVAETATTGLSRPTLPQNVTWQIQYSGEMDYSLDVDAYNIDLFDSDAADIAQLRARGVFVMCYFNAGAYEDWRPDAERFPAKILGKDMEGWEGEKWLDIRNMDALKPIMSARLDLAAQKGCDGVDPDNVNGYTNDTGFPLAYNDQLAYNISLADQARARGLAVGLKNDLEQIPDLQPFFDWVINESCFDYEECHLLLPFKLAGKPVFVIEYDLNPEEFCFAANELGFNAVQKKRELDGFYFPCR
jgi:hypothetical protein